MSYIFYVRISFCLGDKNEKCLKLTAWLWKWLTENFSLLSPLRSFWLLTLINATCIHMAVLAGHMSPISHMIALPPVSWKKILTHHSIQYVLSTFHELLPAALNGNNLPCIYRFWQTWFKLYSCLDRRPKARKKVAQLVTECCPWPFNLHAITGKNLTETSGLLPQSLAPWPLWKQTHTILSHPGIVLSSGCSKQTG